MGAEDRPETSAAPYYAAGAAVCISVAVVIGLVAEPVADTLEYELWVLAIQALLIGALGALLGAAIQENRRNREDRVRARDARRESEARLRDFQREQLTTALNDLALEYRLIKRSRRMLRLERPPGWKLYHDELGRLEDLQRSLEDTQGTLEVLQATTSLRLEPAIDGVKSMIKYLDALWKERELIDEAEYAAATLSRLDEFIEPYRSDDASSFGRVKKPYKSARNHILSQLAELSGAERRATTSDGDTVTNPE